MLRVLREAAFAVARRWGAGAPIGETPYPYLTIDDVAAAAAEARPSALVAAGARMAICVSVCSHMRILMRARIAT